MTPERLITLAILVVLFLAALLFLFGHDGCGVRC